MIGMGWRSAVGLGVGGAAVGAGRFLRNRTAVGALAGGMYGAMSNDTSIMGGALMGAAGARYLGAGFKRASMSGVGMGFRGSVGAYGKAFGRGVVGRAKLDARRGRKIMSNMGANGIRSTLKGWSRGMSPF